VRFSYTCGGRVPLVSYTFVKKLYILTKVYRIHGFRLGPQQGVRLYLQARVRHPRRHSGRTQRLQSHGEELSEQT